MTLELLAPEFTVCQLPENAQADLSVPFTFLARTDRELSLVSPQPPENALKAEAGWRCFRICGALDFSLVGILARIARCLAEKGIPIFAVSTFETDYILLKKEFLPAALNALRDQGYAVKKADGPSKKISLTTEA